MLGIDGEGVAERDLEADGVTLAEEELAAVLDTGAMLLETDGIELQDGEAPTVLLAMDDDTSGEFDDEGIALVDAETARELDADCASDADADAATSVM